MKLNKIQKDTSVAHLGKFVDFLAQFTSDHRAISMFPLKSKEKHSIFAGL